MRLYSELMDKIGTLLEAQAWTQNKAPRRCGVTQPRINELLRGRILRFSLAALANIAAALGPRVYLEFEAA